LVVFSSFFAIAIPNIPLSFALATLTSSNGSDKLIPFIILLTMPLFFSNTKISSEFKKAMLVGKSMPL
jgi:hypothetical protein